MIVGTTVADTPNSFLCTEQTYSDFIFEVELLVEGNMNSGIQFRSESKQIIRMDGCTDTRVKLILPNVHGVQEYLTKHEGAGCIRLI
jgi:hypothetical protein